MSPERWLRGPVPGVPAELQPVAHALLQAREEIEAVAGGLDEAQARARPGGVASVAFHVFHLAGATDRLLALALGTPMTDVQLHHREQELTQDVPDEVPTLLVDLQRSVDAAVDALRAADPTTLGQAREVGRIRYPSTVRGVLCHIAEHAARHAGQVVTTSMILRSGEAR